MVSPTFKISPLVHSFEGRRGEVIPFSFSIESMGREASVSVRPVALTQEITGIILPRDELPGEEFITLNSPEFFELAPGESVTINGELRVPLADTSLFSCGLLVTDQGISDPNDVQAAGNGSRVKVQFRTQYLCRCDVRIPGGRLANVRSVELKPIRIIQHRGWPMVHVYAHNPTSNAMEFELRCRFGSNADVRRSRSFGLTMPVRASLDTNERYTAKILPGATVRLESVIPGSVFDGDYVLQTELIANRRTLAKKETALQIRDTSFPAQQIQIAELAHGLAMEPAQIELSASQNGTRMQTISLTNRSREVADVEFRIASADGRATNIVSLRPTRITIPANGSRRVSISAHPSAYRGSTTFFRVETIVNGRSDQTSMPGLVAVVGRRSNGANISPGPMRMDDSSKGTEIIVPLTNSGDLHLPVSGQIVVMAENGTRHELLDGFGKWLLPGAKTELRFKLPTNLQNGQYQLITDIEFGQRLAAIERTDTVEFPFRVASDETATQRR